MRGQRSIFDPFPETVDLNQRSNSNGTSMDETDDWSNMLYPMERRLLNNDLSNELNYRTFRSWDVGESSSRASQQVQVSSDGQHWSSLAFQDSRLEQQQQLDSSTCHQVNINLNVGFEGINSDDEHMGRASECGPGSSLDHWALSCKRKSVEGTSSQALPEASRSLNISSSLVNQPPVNRHEPPHTRIGVPENSPTPTHTGIRGLPLNNNISSTGNPTSRQILLNEFLDRGQIGNFPNQQPPVMHRPNISRNPHHLPWSSNVGSRNVQYHNFVPPSESRNPVQDPSNWSLATGGSVGGGAPPSSRNGGGGSRVLNGVWTGQHSNHTTPSLQRPTEVPPWSPFPSTEVEYEGQSGHFRAGPSSTPDDNHIQRHNYRPFSRSALLMGIPRDDWWVLAADIEGRQRLVSEIRQVLNAMRRGENLRAEDYMLFDPFINGIVELHDRHRDLRLDVDNMSYEELLALEEHIGNVSTGLSEEVILRSLKQREHISFMPISDQNLEPCCICQEDYDTGDSIGSLDCGHDFHTDCIKQWLLQKNVCPICKKPGLCP